MSIDPRELRAAHEAIASLQFDLSAARAECERLRADAERLAAIADLKHVSVNPWMVQAYRSDELVGSAYHKTPMTGTPFVHGSKLSALRAAIDAILTKTGAIKGESHV